MELTMRLDHLEKISNKSFEYWEYRYLIGADSGPGSYNFLADFKAKILNSFVDEHNIKNVLEFGSGDGNQLSLANYKNYFGLDVSQTAVNICKEKFKSDFNKSFCVYKVDEAENLVNFLRAELVLSLDVIYHLVEDDIFENYVKNLFNTSTRFVIIYSSNFEDNVDVNQPFMHVRHRKITDYIEKNILDYKFLKEIKNVYTEPFASLETVANFYIYEKIGV